MCYSSNNIIIYITKHTKIAGLKILVLMLSLKRLATGNYILFIFMPLLFSIEEYE